MNILKKRTPADKKRFLRDGSSESQHDSWREKKEQESELEPRSSLQLFSNICFTVRRCRPQQVSFRDGRADLLISLEFLNRRPESMRSMTVHLEEPCEQMCSSRVREHTTYFFIYAQNRGGWNDVTASSRL